MENSNSRTLKAEQNVLSPITTSFERAISLWWKHFKTFILIYWQGFRLALIPLLIFITLYLVDFKTLNEASWFLFSNLTIYIVSFLLSFYFILRAQIAVLLFIKDDFKGKPKKLFLTSRSLFWPYLGLSLLTAVLVILWTLLLIIPGIVFSVFYSLAIFVFLSEGKLGMAAIRRSYALVRGNFWQLLLRFLFFILVIIIFSSIIAMPAIPLEEGSLAFSIWDFIVQVISLLVAPIYLIFFYDVYKRLARLKK